MQNESTAMTHRLAHAALAVVYVVAFAILTREHAFPHAGCVLAAALIYALMSWRSAPPPKTPTTPPLDPRLDARATEEAEEDPGHDAGQE